MHSRVLAVLSVFASGLVYYVLPRGAFGTHDVVIRAAVTGAVAGATCLLILKLIQQRERSRN